jgi:methionyl-tRNA formyltransferase
MPPRPARLGGRTWVVERLDLVENAPSSTGLPGDILEHLADGLVVQTGDGPVRLKALPGAESAG